MFILFIFIFSQFKKKRIATIAIAPVKDKPKYSHATYTNNNKVYENVIASDKAICAIEHSNKNITSYYFNLIDLNGNKIWVRNHNIFFSIWFIFTV